jgi:hypothetical protein
MYIKKIKNSIITTTNNSQPHSSQLKLFHNNKLKKFMKTFKKLNKIKHQNNLLSFLISQKNILNGEKYNIICIICLTICSTVKKTIKIRKKKTNQTIYLHIYI